MHTLCLLLNSCPATAPCVLSGCMGRCGAAVCIDPASARQAGNMGDTGHMGLLGNEREEHERAKPVCATAGEEGREGGEGQ